MNDRENYDSRLWKVLEKEKLADLSQFHQRGFADEVPLYSRESDMAFLPADRESANAVLLTFALKFLRAVIAYEEHRRGYFAAVTVWSLSPAPLVPNLFVWSGGFRELEDKLALQGVTTPFGKQINRLVRKQRLTEPFEVLEDASTIPEATRAFIAPARPPYPGFVALDTFRRPAQAPPPRRLRA